MSVNFAQEVNYSTVVEERSENLFGGVDATSACLQDPCEKLHSRDMM